MSADAELPQQIGPYAVEAQLGRGGMGAVYRARAPGGGHVAVKVIRADMLHDADVRRRFTREARAAARLQHPSIAAVLDFGTWNGQSAIVMELVQGELLTRWRRHPPDGGTLHSVFADMLGALAHAHARGVVHRDLKPENVMVSFDDAGRPVAKIMDFGVAHFREERTDAEDGAILIGTPAYMSPEQALRASDVSPAADLYAIGVMLFELVSGRLPYDAKSAAGQLFAHLNNPIPAVEPRPGYRVTGAIDALIGGLMAKRPTDRYLFAIDALRDLEAIAIEGTGGDLPAPEASDDEHGPAQEHSTVLHRVTVRNAEPHEVSAAAPFALFALRDAPFTARRDELLELRAVAQDALAANATRVVLLSGETGVGRSRLLAELREQLEESGTMQAWSGRCADWGEGDDVVREALRRGLGVMGLPVADTSLRLRELLERDKVSDPWEHATLLEYVGPPDGRVASQRLKHENARWALVERVLNRAATRRPVALLLDDVHLSDGAPARLCDWLLSTSGAQPPCLIVLSVRADTLGADTPFATALAALRERPDEAVRHLPVARLDLRAMQELVGSAVPIDPTVASGVAMRAGGNPLIGIETLRHLVDSGRLEGYGDAPTIEEVLLDLPVGIGEILARRVEEAARSPDADAHTIGIWKRLAVLGGTFDQALAEALLEHADPMPPPYALSRALAAGVVTGVLREDPPGVFQFDAAPLRDALCGMAEREGTLRAHHAAAARALEGLGTVAQRDHSGEIARHHAAADERPAAARFFAIDAAAAARRKSFEHALASWELATRYAREAEGTPHAELERMLLGAADALLHLGRYDAALARIGESERFAPAGTRGAEAMRLTAEIAARQGNLREARALYQRAVDGFAAAGDPDRQAWAQVGLAGVELRDGRTAVAEQTLLRARDRFGAAGDIHGEATVLLALGRAALDTGLADEAREFARKGQRRHTALGDRHGAALCLLLEGEIAVVEGRTAEAAEAVDAARGELLAAGDRHGAARATYLLGVLAETGGRELRARTLFRDAVRTFDALGDQQYATLTRLALARLDAETGAWEAAEPAIDRVLQRDADERNDDAQFITLLVETAKLAILSERNALAKQLLETAAWKLGRTAHGNALYDRVDEVQYLLHELAGDGTPLDDDTDVTTLAADAGSGEEDER